MRNDGNEGISGEMGTILVDHLVAGLGEWQEGVEGGCKRGFDSEKVVDFRLSTYQL